jgi:leucine dehydrogenase
LVVGHVGTPLIHFLFEVGVSKIIASDVDAHRSASILSEFSSYVSENRFELRIVDKSDLSILFEDVDAVAPCATGGILNKETIPKIQAKIVCGAANNQLLGN